MDARLLFGMVDILLQHRVTRFILAGGAAALVNLFLLYLLVDYLGVQYLWSAGIAFGLAIVVSFLLQKYWTFGDNLADKVPAQLVAYVLIGIFNLVLNVALMYFFVEYVGVWYLLSQVFSGAVIATQSFFVYQRFIFKVR